MVAGLCCVAVGFGRSPYYFFVLQNNHILLIVDISYSNVPDGRIVFRSDTLKAEMEYLEYCTSTRVRKKVSRESSALMREEREYTKLNVSSLDDTRRTHYISFFFYSSHISTLILC